MTMKRNLSSSLFLLLGVAVAGCAADAPGLDDGIVDPGNGNGHDDDDWDDDSDQPVPLTPEGKFAVQSDFDLATNLPGVAGTAINYFIDATDDPDDPAKFILEQVLSALPNGSVKDTLQGAVPFVAGYLNDRLLQVAPDFISKIVEVGDAFGQIARHFGTLETLEIGADGRAVKKVEGLHFKVDGVDLDFEFADYNIAVVTVPNVQVTLEQNGKLLIEKHRVPLKYGAIMRLALEEAILPMIDPSLTDLESLLLSVINCQAVGQYIYNAIEVGSPSTFESACRTGIGLAENALYRALDNIDASALEFEIFGTSRAVDRNDDGKMDEIQSGRWTGGVWYAGSPASLSDASRFFGKRI
jgi:hypothetical protein